MQRIVSKDNKKIKRLKGLGRKKVRSGKNLFLIEGAKSVREAVSTGAVIDLIAVSEGFASSSGLAAELDEAGHDLIVVPDDLFCRISTMVNPEGIMASVEMPVHSIEEIAGFQKPIVLLDGIRDPGNLGTIIRTADAFGFGGVILTGECVDVYNPKCVQASMGSVLRVATVTAGPQDPNVLKDSGYRAYGLDLGGNDIAPGFSFPVKSILCIGSESHGLSDRVSGICDEFVRIPMSGSAESLNAAVAAAIAMFMVE